MVGMSVVLFKWQHLACLAHEHLGQQGSCPRGGCIVIKMAGLPVAPSIWLTQPSDFLLRKLILSLKHQIKNRLGAFMKIRQNSFLLERTGSRDVRYVFTDVHSSIIPSSLKCLWKQNVLSLCTRILFIHKGKGRLTQGDMDESWGYWDEWDKSIIKYEYCEIEYSEPRMQGVGTESTVWAEAQAKWGCPGSDG